jgi:hypothetical protein
MAKVIKETFTEACPGTNLNISTDEIVQTRFDTSSVIGDLYRIKRICTKTDNALKCVMKAHLEERASQNYKQ